MDISFKMSHHHIMNLERKIDSLMGQQAHHPWPGFGHLDQPLPVGPSGAVGGPSTSAVWVDPSTSAVGGPSTSAVWVDPSTSAVGGPSTSAVWVDPSTSAVGGPSTSAVGQSAEIESGGNLNCM